MGRNNIKINFKNKYYDVLYVGIWLIPFLFFARDFFILKDIKHILNYRTLLILYFTLKQSFISATLAMFLGIIPGIYLSKSKGLLVKLINASVFIPFFFPIISTVISFSIIFNSSLFSKYKILYTLTGIVIANVFYNVPIFVKYLGEALKNIDKSQIEAFKIESNSRLKLYYYIYFPLVKGAMQKAYFLTFSYCFTSFGIILAIGGIRFTTLEVAIATTLRGSFDFSKAFSYGILQFIILLLLNLFIHKDDEVHEGKVEVRYRKSNIFEKLYVMLYLFCEYAVVLISLVFAFYNYFDNSFSTKYFLRLFSRDFNKTYPIIKALLNSSILGIISSIISIGIVYIFIKNRHKYSHIFLLSSLGVSSAFLGIALIYLNILFNIPYALLLILAYLIITVPIAYSFMYYHISHFDSSLLEASYLDGAGAFQSFIYIEFPLLKNIFFSTFLQVFTIIFAEFTISYTMQIGEYFPTISLINYSLSNSKHFLESSALGGLNTGIIILIFIISQIISNKNTKNELE